MNRLPQLTPTSMSRTASDETVITPSAESVQNIADHVDDHNPINDFDQTTSETEITSDVEPEINHNEPLDSPPLRRSTRHRPAREDRINPPYSPPDQKDASPLRESGCWH